jgi:hypothetical protein
MFFGGALSHSIGVKLVTSNEASYDSIGVIFCPPSRAFRFVAGKWPGGRIRPFHHKELPRDNPFSTIYKKTF